jgi:hypothetical protein
MTKKTRQFAVYSLLPAVLVAGCAASSDKYPSLAIRDFEREAAAAPSAPTQSAAPVAATPAISSATMAALNRARDRAARENAAFLSALPRVRSAVAAARGSGPGSDRWSEAQVSLADLISRRSETAVVLGDVDLLIADAAITAKGAPYPRDIQSEVAGMLARQDQAIAQLKRGL